LLCEAFVPGGEVAVEGLLRAGRLELLAIFDKPEPLDGPFFAETIYVTPSRLPAQTQRRIADVTEAAARALGLGEGPIHAELRLPPGQGPVILEVAARSIGGLCARTLRFGAGRSLEEIVLCHAAGLPLPSLRRERAAAGVLMLPIPAAGTLQSIGGVAEAQALPLIEDVVITVRPGERLVPLPEGSSYAGFVFARGDEAELVEQALRRARELLTFEVAPSLPVARIAAPGGGLLRSGQP
ncbi:MAG: ATP-grasp domain-containing protein, partial [Deltaproteobacteria bacterium]